MDLKVLEYFLTVIREGNISAAAETLHMSQPNLSRHMSTLEREVGATLFVRGNRRVELTDRGMVMKRRAEEILGLVELTKAEVGAPDAVGGEIRMGCGETRAFGILAEAAVRFRERNPSVTFSVHSGNAEDVIDKLDKGLLDFGVLIEPAQKKNYEFLRLPATDRWGVLMPKGCELSLKRSVSPGDLRGLPLICSRQAMVDSEFAGWFGPDTKPNVVATYNLLYNASLMVSEGMGYALCIDGIVNGEGLCFRPLEPAMEVGVSVVWRNGALGRAARMYLEELKGGFPPAPKDGR